MARKNPRLHIRFKSHAELDKIEIWANQRGQKLGTWVYQAIKKQAELEAVDAKLASAADFSILEAVAILREVAGPDITKDARDSVDGYLETINAEIKNDFR